jgi:hypothetical protein
MTTVTLKEMLTVEGIPSKWYLLDSKGVKEDKICLEHADNMWNVFYSERGKKYDLLSFATENEACENLLARLRERNNRTRK